MSLRLTSFCILDKDGHRGKFQFKLHSYSKSRHKLSKAFQFAGHTWRLQTTKKDGHFGMFLRWNSVTRDDITCITSLKFSIINNFFPDDSITEGSSKEKDVFDKEGLGIGYSRIVSLKELESSPGYLLNDTICLQLYLKIKSTTFKDELPIVLRKGQYFKKGESFHFQSTDWNVVLFPQGENEARLKGNQGSPEKNGRNMPDFKFKNPKKYITGLIKDVKKYRKGANEQNEDTPAEPNDENYENDEANDGNEGDDEEEEDQCASIYMMRDVSNAQIDLRHDVKFKISVENGHDVALEQHFYGTDSNVFGTASLMGVGKLEKLCKDKNLKVEIKFLQTVPYVYFAYHLQAESPRLNAGFSFEDQHGFPWTFQFLNYNADSEFLKAQLVLDADNMSKKVKLFYTQRKILFISWFVELLSPKDITQSITFVPRGKREVRECAFTKGGDNDVIIFPVTIEEVLSEDGPFLDEEGSLCVKLAVLCSNFIEESDVGESYDIYEQMKTENNVVEEENNQDKNVVDEERETEDDEKVALIKSLNDHIDAYETYIKNLHKDHQKAVNDYEENSIVVLKQKSRPSPQDYEDLTSLAKDLESVIRTLPLNIKKVLYAGALGQNTIVANHYQLDFVLFLKDYDEYIKSFKIVLNVVQARIKEHCSLPDSPALLPQASYFYRTSKGLLFRLGEVNVTILLSRPLESFGGYQMLYQRAAKAKKQRIALYNVLASERQIEFIKSCDNACKDLICVVKTWSNTIKWKNTESRPSSYLLSLLVIHAYHTIKRMNVSKTPSFDKEVLLEFGRVVSKEEFSIEWSTYYTPSDFPWDESHETFYRRSTVLRDPAMPYHNVAVTGIAQWDQFRVESHRWVMSLNY